MKTYTEYQMIELRELQQLVLHHFITEWEYIARLEAI